MSGTTEPFSYPSLPIGVDALRILSIEPGDFFDPLICTLTPIAFGDKPKYVALSYTWSDPYSDMISLPTSSDGTDVPDQSPNTIAGHLQDTMPLDRTGTSPEVAKSSESAYITLNDRPFKVGHNLCLVLLHLRSPTVPLALWVDAVCINQADTEERNAQVTLMSFIYRRATKVVAWLGTKEYKTKLDLFRFMSFEWRAGQGQHFAASVASSTELHCSLEPDQSTVARIAESSYWTRLWIVQELCLPRILAFVYGSNIWTYENLQQWSVLKAARSKTPNSKPSSQEKAVDRFTAMLQRLDARSSKFSARLESLIERFASSKCTDMKDKVYGLLGLANDIRPFSKVNSPTPSVEQYIESLDIQSENLPKPQRGMGSLPVDYCRSYYEIWADVVKFVYFRARNASNTYYNGLRYHDPNFDVNVSLSLKERCISVVRTASIVQEALGQKVEKSIISVSRLEHVPDHPVIRSIGYLSGKIVHLGPCYEPLVASFQAQQDWLNSWDDHYQEPTDLETLLRVDEEYTAKILNFEKKDLARINGICNPYTVAWQFTGGYRPNSSDSWFATEYTKIWTAVDDEQTQPSEPRIYLGTNHTMGLVPPLAKVGDVIIRFWNCDAAILMRPIDPKVCTNAMTTSSFMLVGRADVAVLPNAKDSPECVPQIGDIVIDNSVLDFQLTQAVYVDLDLRTLQLITASIRTWR